MKDEYVFFGIASVMIWEEANKYERKLIQTKDQITEFRSEAFAFKENNIF